MKEEINVSEFTAAIYTLTGVSDLSQFQEIHISGGSVTVVTRPNLITELSLAKTIQIVNDPVGDDEFDPGDLDDEYDPE